MSIERKSSEPFEKFEHLDEKAIEQEVKGMYVRSLVYQYSDKGRQVTGLSIRGVEESARLLLKEGYNIAVDQAKITEETPTEYRSACKVTYTNPNGAKMESWGYSKTDKKYFNGTTNPFAYVQALSKAQRNALRTVIPEKYMVEFVNQFLEEAKKDKRKIIEVESEEVEEEPIIEEKAEEKPLEAEPIKPSPFTHVTPETTQPKEYTPIPPKIENGLIIKPEIKIDKTNTFKTVNSNVESGVKIKIEMVKVGLLQDIPQIYGADNLKYGPSKAGAVLTLPKLNAEMLIQSGKAIMETVQPIIKDEIEEEMVKTYFDLKGKTENHGTIGFTAPTTVKAAFTPPIPFDDNLIGNFLIGGSRDIIGRLADKMSLDGRELDYNFKQNEGMLEEITFNGPISEAEVKGLISPLVWFVERTLENEAKKKEQQ